MSSNNRGLGASGASTRPTRRESRAQTTGLASMITPATQEAAAEITAVDDPVTPSPAPSTKTTPRIQAAASKVQKVPYSTQIDHGTARRVDWLIRSKGYKKTDITADALDALLDILGVPPADEL